MKLLSLPFIYEKTTLRSGSLPEVSRIVKWYSQDIYSVVFYSETLCRPRKDLNGSFLLFFIYLFKRQSSSRLKALIHKLTPHMPVSSQDWASPGLRARNSIQVCHAGGRNPVPGAITATSPTCISRSQRHVLNSHFHSGMQAP